MLQRGGVYSTEAEPRAFLAAASRKLKRNSLAYHRKRGEGGGGGAGGQVWKRKSRVGRRLSTTKSTQGPTGKRGGAAHFHFRVVVVVVGVVVRTFINV